MQRLPEALDGAAEIPPQSLQSRHRPALQLQVGEGRPRAVTLKRALGSGIQLLGRQMLARFSDQPLPLRPLILLDAAAGALRAPAGW